MDDIKDAEEKIKVLKEKVKEQLHTACTMYMDKVGMDEFLNFMCVELLTLGSTLMIEGEHKENGRKPVLKDVLELFDTFIEGVKKVFNEGYEECLKEVKEAGANIDSNINIPTLSTEEINEKAQRLLKKMMDNSNEN